MSSSHKILLFCDLVLLFFFRKKVMSSVLNNLSKTKLFQIVENVFGGYIDVGGGTMSHTSNP